MADDLTEARRYVAALKVSLGQAIERGDNEQELRGDDLPAIDAVIAMVKRLRPNDPVVQEIRELVSPDAVESGEPHRVIDVLHKVGLLEAALGPEPPPGPAYGFIPADPLPKHW